MGDSSRQAGRQAEGRGPPDTGEGRLRGRGPVPTLSLGEREHFGDPEQRADQWGGRNS